LVWGARASNVDLSAYDWLTRLIYRFARVLSSAADVVVVNSRAGAAHHSNQGYPQSRLQVIPNGIDTNRFQPDPVGRERLRREWGVPPHAPLVGLVGRLDPMKDHRTFLEAAAILAARHGDVRFVAVGGGAGLYADMLIDHAARAGISDRLTWAGIRADMPAVYSALDLSTSTSVGEGFPNAVAEAMACGTPCVVTDVGDSAWIVGNPGEVVPARDPASLANAWENVLVKRPVWPSIERRARIVREFSVERLVTDTERLLWPARDDPAAY
jgi:glycosyltransferase involved in cell wall biosynthesis